MNPYDPTFRQFLRTRAVGNSTKASGARLLLGFPPLAKTPQSFARHVMDMPEIEDKEHYLGIILEFDILWKSKNSGFVETPAQGWVTLPHGGHKRIEHLP